MNEGSTHRLGPHQRRPRARQVVLDRITLERSTWVDWLSVLEDRLADLHDTRERLLARMRRAQMHRRERHA